MTSCVDTAQPGVNAVVSYLNSLPNHPKPNCAPGAYYLLNNYNPGYNGNGSVNTSAFTIPPSPMPTIGDSLIAKRIPWKYYGEGWNSFVANSPQSVYCNICNPFLYETSIMSDPNLVSGHLKDTANHLQASNTSDSLARYILFMSLGPLLCQRQNPDNGFHQLPAIERRIYV